MHKQMIFTLVTAMLSTHAFAGTMEENAIMAVAAADSNFYLETSKATKLTVFHPDVTGNLSVSSQLSVPENSILSVNLTSFSYRANNDWVCGVRIVDAMDENLRESDAADETNFCIKATDAKKLTLIDSSNGQNKEAFLKYQKTGQMNELNERGLQVANLQQQMQGMVQTFKAASTKGNGIISPLKNCGLGCLTATSEYGTRIHPVLKTKRMHKGIDLRAKVGQQVVSVYDGKVLATRSERNKRTNKLKGYGHYVIVVHPGRQMETLYAHLSAFKTTAGKPVTQGQLIALSGNTGIGTAPHLHFEIHVSKNRNYVPVNPRSYISSLLNVSL